MRADAVSSLLDSQNWKNSSWSIIDILICIGRMNKYSCPNIYSKRILLRLSSFHLYCVCNFFTAPLDQWNKCSVICWICERSLLIWFVWSPINRYSVELFFLPKVKYPTIPLKECYSFLGNRNLKLFIFFVNGLKWKPGCSGDRFHLFLWSLEVQGAIWCQSQKHLPGEISHSKYVRV